MVFKRGNRIVENYALRFTSSGKKSKFVTVIDTKVGVTGKPYFRTGSNGKYLRFALTQDGEKFDIKFRENESKINIEIIFGDEAIVHEIDKIDEG